MLSNVKLEAKFENITCFPSIDIIILGWKKTMELVDQKLTESFLILQKY